MSARTDSTLSCLEVGTKPRVYFVNNSDHVGELATDGASWEYRQLPGATVRPGSGLSSVTINNHPHVCYVGVDNRVHELSKREGHWADKVFPESKVREGSPISCLAVDQELLAFYIHEDNYIAGIHTHRGPWCPNPQTGKTPRVPTPLSSVVLGGSPHIFYVGEDNITYMLRKRKDEWIAEALPGNEVRDDSAISPRIAGESDLEVYYVDKNNHVNELATKGDAWANTVIPDTVVIIVLGGGLLRWPPGLHGPVFNLPWIVYLAPDDQIAAVNKSADGWVKKVLPKPASIRNYSPIAVKGNRVYYIDANDKVNLLEKVENEYVNTLLQ